MAAAIALAFFGLILIIIGFYLLNNSYKSAQKILLSQKPEELTQEQKLTYLNAAKSKRISGLWDAVVCLSISIFCFAIALATILFEGKI